MLSRVAVAQRLPPPFILEIPANGLFDPAFEILLRFPTKLAFELRRINGIANVVTRAIGYELDQVAPRMLRRSKAVERFADGVDDVDIAPLMDRP